MTVVDPKSEVRRQKEIQSPKAEVSHRGLSRRSADWLTTVLPLLLRESQEGDSASRTGATLRACTWLPDFGFRISAFFRPSDFLLYSP